MLLRSLGIVAPAHPQIVERLFGDGLYVHIIGWLPHQQLLAGHNHLDGALFRAQEPILDAQFGQLSGYLQGQPGQLRVRSIAG